MNLPDKEHRGENVVSAERTAVGASRGQEPVGVSDGAAVFEDSLLLFEALGKIRLQSQRDLRRELSFGGEVSLWDVIGPYLILYRFPLLVSRDGGPLSWRQRLEHIRRPYRGLAARFRDAVLSVGRRNATACSAWRGNKPTVVFLGFSPTYYRDVLHPVAEILARENHVEGVALGCGPNPTLTLNCDGKLRYESIWSHWDRRVDSQARSMLRLLLATQAILSSRGDFSELGRGAHRNLDVAALRCEFRWLFWREFRRLIPQMAIASHIFDRHRPAMIVSADDADQRCRVYSVLGRRRGIPSLIVQQGFTVPGYPDWRLLCGDAVAAMGATSRKVLAKQGVPPERIAVTGHPGFDCLLFPEPEACLRLRANLGVADGHTMLLFASQPFYVGSFRTPEIRRDMIRAICRAAESVENIRLVIKPHPRDNVYKLRQLIGSRAGIEVVHKEADISALIKACDILVTFFSQSAIQALYAGKPVINVDFSESGGPRLYSESGATWTARSSDEIASHLRRLTGKLRGQEIAKREAARQRFLREWVHVPDGQAAQRVADLIYQRLGIKKT